MAKTKSTSFQAETFLLSDWADRSDHLPADLFTSAAIPTQPTTFVSLDEVGRGCVAGPVVVCATLWQAGHLKKEFAEWVDTLRDSKKMSARSREDAFESALRETLLNPSRSWSEPPDPRLQSEKSGRKLTPEQLHLPHQVNKWTDKNLSEQLKMLSRKRASVQSYTLASACVGSASAAEIDQFGIIPALGMAASRALSDLPSAPRPQVVFFDGHRPISLISPWQDLPQILITKGDDLLKSISASSVIAKVIRDRWMEKYSTLYPSYFFEEHRGYGTEKHREAILRRGPTPLHRMTFLKNICPESGC